ncbi:MAG TPA: TonB-dependent receptor [Thermoanaerobaculia bacterium]|nr:TonB-dependent receptor [Thermoanaerobaculia bacterium]
MLRRRLRPIGLGLLLALLEARPAAPQTTGSIDGVVRDGSGGALSGADVLVSSPSLQGARTARTSADGRFWLPALPPGTYSVTATLAGFRPEAKSVVVALSAKATLTFTLEPSVSAAVSVSGAAPPIDVTSTTGGTNYTSSVISRLPVSRNYADIVRSNPGVGTDQADSQGRSLSLTIYGATSAENQWIIDGVNTTNSFKGVQGKAINNEFVEEVEVKTDGYQAEYGGALGGVVNVVTKSGGNSFHGDGFLYYDSNGTSAAQVVSDAASTTMRLADYSRTDYGFDLGGYVVKDRLWFFGAYNRVHLSGNVSRVVDTPPSDPTPVSAQDKFPLDNAGNLYSGKLTWNVAPSTSVVATVFADPSTMSGAAGADPLTGPAGLQAVPIYNPDPSTWSSARSFGGTDFGLRASQLLGPSAVLNLQASQHIDRNSLSAASTIRYEDDTCAGGTPDDPCTPPTNPNTVSGGFGWIDGELGNNHSRSTQLRGEVTFDAGSHELKAGGGYQIVHSNMTYAVSGSQLIFLYNEQGTLYYRHEFSAPSGNESGFSAPLPTAPFRATIHNGGAYLQDSWRPSPGLTVNIGLRWDAEQLIDYTGSTRLRFNQEWQPRLGVAWDPWKDGRTKLYAFAGRFFYRIPTAAMTWWFADVTGVDTYNFDPVSTIPNPNVPGHDCNGCDYDVWFGGGPYGAPVDAGVQEMYQDEYTIGAERLLDPTLTVGLKGTYRRLGNALEDRCDFQDVMFNCAVINPGSNGAYARGDAPTCNYLDDLYNQCFPSGPASPPARRTYKGIEILARKSFTSSFWLQASYVYSSLTGNYDGGVNEEFLGTVPGRNTDFDLPALWQNASGRLFLDRPHRFRLDSYWITPLRLAVGVQAWAASGAPFGKIGYYNYGYSEMLYLVPRGSAGRLPTQWDANLTVSYPIAVGPATVTLQAYLYNLFNNQIATTEDIVWNNQSWDGYPNSMFNQPKTNPNYGKVTARTDPRLFRAAVRVSF